jgi:hypothetical protein
MPVLSNFINIPQRNNLQKKTRWVLQPRWDNASTSLGCTEHPKSITIHNRHQSPTTSILSRYFCTKKHIEAIPNKPRHRGCPTRSKVYKKQTSQQRNPFQSVINIDARGFTEPMDPPV